MKLISIDSLKIRIPLEKCECDKKVLERIVLNGHGEVIDEGEFKEKRYMLVEPGGIKTSYLIKKVNDTMTTKRDYLIIMFNSKLLLDRYFEGLNMNNIRFVYLAIINQGLAKFSYRDFLQALCSDIDIKIDFNLPGGDFRKFNLSLEFYTSEQKKIITKIFNEKNKSGKLANQGIQWGERRSSDWNNKNFVKFYNKVAELNTRHKEFLDYAFKDVFMSWGIDINNIQDITTLEHVGGKPFRFEVTLKNRQHLAQYGIKKTSLFDLLNIKQETLKDIMIKSLAKHLNIFDYHFELQKEGYTPREWVVWNLFKMNEDTIKNYNNLIEQFNINIDTLQNVLSILSAGQLEALGLSRDLDNNILNLDQKFYSAYGIIDALAESIEVKQRKYEVRKWLLKILQLGDPEPITRKSKKVFTSEEFKEVLENIFKSS